MASSQKDDVALVTNPLHEQDLPEKGAKDGAEQDLPGKGAKDGADSDRVDENSRAGITDFTPRELANFRDIAPFSNPNPRKMKRCQPFSPTYPINYGRAASDSRFT